MILAARVMAFCREKKLLHSYFTQISYFRTKDLPNSQIIHRNFTKTSQFECLARDLRKLCKTQPTAEC
jgi:hypothetical protein